MDDELPAACTARSERTVPAHPQGSATGSVPVVALAAALSAVALVAAAAPGSAGEAPAAAPRPAACSSVSGVGADRDGGAEPAASGARVPPDARAAAGAAPAARRRALPQDPGAPSPRRATLVVEFVGMRSDVGALRLALFPSPIGFPNESARARRASIVPIRGRRARVVWSDVEPGHYAVAALHDENGNGVLDKNWLGMPNEGSGFSRDATGSWGPPDFDDAMLVLPADRVVRARIAIQYF